MCQKLGWNELPCGRILTKARRGYVHEVSQSNINLKRRQFATQSWEASNREEVNKHEVRWIRINFLLTVLSNLIFPCKHKSYSLQYSVSSDPSEQSGVPSQRHVNGMQSELLHLN
jgi:hypothetical protein